MNTTDTTDTPPQVVKKQDFETFIGFVEQGLWKNNKFIASLVGVEEETISAWKKQPRAVVARQQATKNTLTSWKAKGDPEKRLKEQGMEFESDKLDVSMKIEVKGLENI